MPPRTALPNRKTEVGSKCRYNSRLIKGGALLEDMRLLVRHWEDSNSDYHGDVTLVNDLLSSCSSSRARDIFFQVFLPRFVNGSPRRALKIVRELEDRNVSIEILRPVYYWITARNERLLYDFVCDELLLRNQRQEQTVTTDSVVAWLKSRLTVCGKTWSEAVTIRVAQGILATLRDFGILEGAAKKRVAPVYIPIESFAYIAFAIWKEGTTGSSLVNHNDWALFLFSPSVVERISLEADRHGLLRYQAAGGIVRIDFPFYNFEEMADAIATRTY